MTEIASIPPAAPQSVPDDGPPVRARRSWIGEVLFNTFGRWGARVGLLWILIVAFCALFAPLLANSDPLAVKMDGRWSSPMVRYLTAVDWMLMTGGLVFLILLPVRSMSLGRRVVWSAVVVLLAASPLVLLIKPPQRLAFDTYRAAAREGRVERAIHAPIRFSPNDLLRDQFDPNRPQPWAPSGEHPLGTDVNGGDILSNMIHACRIAMSIGFISTGISVCIGILVGGLMGYFAGIVDILGMRLVEIFGAIPTIYLLLTFVAYYNRDIYLIMAIIGLTSWVGDARFVRAEFLKLRKQDFVQAAIASGVPLRSVLFRHILPNAVAPLLVSASFGVASAIIAESTLSFLGLGLVFEPSWGRLLNMARGVGGGFHWWLAVFPGLAIFLTVLSYNLIGQSFRDALDPKLRGAK